MATTANAWVAWYSKVAAGADAAPAFTATLSGTVAMTVTLFELAGAASPLTAFQAYASGGASATLSAMVTGQSAPPPNGAYALTAYVMERAAAANTWNPGSGWANVVNDAATSSVLHAAVDSQVPATGAVVTGSGHWSTNTTAFGAALLLVVSPPNNGLEAYTDLASTTVSSGGTTAPAAGTPETLTVASASPFPAAQNTCYPPVIYHGADPDDPSELFAVINQVSSTSLQVTRGAEGTTPVAHTAGWTLQQVMTSSGLGNILHVYNIRSPRFGAKGDGASDDFAAAQLAASSCFANGGGIVYGPEGVYCLSQTLQIGSRTMLLGAGRGVTTFKAINGFAATQVGSGSGDLTLNPGMCLIATAGNGVTRQNRIAVRDLTVDGNEAGVGFPLPGYAAQNECSPLGLTGVDDLQIERVEVINSVGYAVLPRACTRVVIRDCVITTGQAVVQTYVTQDGIHAIDCSYMVISGNIIDTGHLVNPANGNINVGDDCICIQGVLSGSAHVSITGNTILASGARGITLVLGGATVTDVTISGNVINNTQYEGILAEYGIWTSGYQVSDVAISGNTIYNVALSGAGRGITLDDAQNTGHTGAGWRNVAITGNTFDTISDTGGGGIYCGQGSNLSICGNTFYRWNCNTGIQVGDNQGTAEPVSAFTISGNTVDLSATSGGSPVGIIAVEATTGSITGNAVLGAGLDRERHRAGCCRRADHGDHHLGELGEGLGAGDSGNQRGRLTRLQHCDG